MSETDRMKAFELLGIKPAAQWCWDDSDLVRALAQGIVVTSDGARPLAD